MSASLDPSLACIHSNSMSLCSGDHDGGDDDPDFDRAVDKPTVALEILLALTRNMPEIVPEVLVATAWAMAEAHMRRVREFMNDVPPEVTDAPG